MPNLVNEQKELRGPFPPMLAWIRSLAFVRTRHRPSYLDRAFLQQESYWDQFLPRLQELWIDRGRALFLPKPKA